MPTPGQFQRLATLLALGVAVVAGMLLGLKFIKPTTVALAQARPECPQDTLNSDFKLPGPITRVPEFHDCQRFILQHRRWLRAVPQYDSLYAVFARYRLDSLVFRSTKCVSATPGHDITEVTGVLSGDTVPSIAATVRSALPADCTSSEVFTQTNAVPVALIVSYGGTYSPLGITSGFNCLYLYRAGGWQATMAHVSSDADCFDDADPNSLVGTGLTVKLDHGFDVSAYGPDDYPPVARWDWDRTTGIYYIGLRCGAAWCEVGQEGFASSPHHATNGPRTRVIKGWYDEQVLATASATTPTPSGLQTKKEWATLFPDLGLDALTIDGMTATPHWVTVARSALPPSLPGYAAKLNFEHGSAFAGMNTIELCYGRKRDCVPPRFLNTVECAGDPSVSQYWARVTAVSGKVVYRCIVYCDHSGIDIPGTARWRWLANDETTWTRCPDGCCKLQ